MPTGFCPYLLEGMPIVAGTATPQYKIRPHGFLSMLLNTENPDAISISSVSGHQNEFRISYRKPGTRALTTTSPSCESVLTPSKVENIPVAGTTRGVAIHLDNNLVSQYCSDASQVISAKGAKPATSVMREMVDIIMSYSNGLLDAMNRDLLGLVTWGKNVVSGDNSAVTVNLPKDLTVQPIDGGMTKLMTDYDINGLTGRPAVVGTNLSLGYFRQQQWKGGVDQGGFDSRIVTSMMDYYHDRAFASVVGTQDFGVFEPGSIHLVQHLKYRGFQGQKLANSEFGIIPLPWIDPTDQMLKMVWFDYQLREVDCEQTFTDSYTSQSFTAKPGRTLILSKTFGLFQLPSDSYRPEDSYFGVNGALRYTASNSCDSCS